MIALIVGMMTSRRSVDHRAKAVKALRSLMFSLIPDQAIPALHALGVHIVPDGIDEPCNAMLQGDDVCCHMRGLLDTHNEETDFRSTYLDILVYMFGEERGCNVISAMLQAHLGKLMRLLLTRMIAVAVDDPLKFDWHDLMLQNHRERGDESMLMYNMRSCTLPFKTALPEHLEVWQGLSRVSLRRP